MDDPRNIDFEDQVFPIPETAQHLHVSRAMAYKLAKAGKLEITKLRNRSLVTGRAINGVKLDRHLRHLTLKGV